MKDSIKKAKWEHEHSRRAIDHLFGEITVNLSYQRYALFFKWKVTSIVGGGYSSRSFINEEKANIYFEELIKKHNLKEVNKDTMITLMREFMHKNQDKDEKNDSSR